MFASLILGATVTGSMPVDALPTTPEISGPLGVLETPAGSIGTLYPDNIAEDEYLALPVDDQLALKVSNEPNVPYEDIPGLLPKDVVKFSDDLNVFSDTIYALGVEYASVYTSYSVDAETKTITIGLAANAPERAAAEFKAKVAEVLAQSGYPVTFLQKGLPFANVQAVSNEFVSDFKTWMPRFGGGEFYTVPMAEEGFVDVYTEGVPSEEWTSFEYRGIPVIVTELGGDTIVGQTRLADNTPYYAGDRLNYSQGPLCTSGFSWVIWSSGSVKGSTAEHCYRMSGHTTYYNNGSLFGNRFAPIYGSQGDAMLITPSPGRTFAARVWVGTTASGASFPVVGASSLPVGAPVALHASFGTPFVTTVAAGPTAILFQTPLGNYPIYNLIKTWASDANCINGDSGGPWITDNGAGKATAHGQHFGVISAGNGISYCYFVDINTISAALQSTLLTAP